MLITGGAGFIGSHITEFFINKGLEVVIVDNLTSGHPDNIHPKSRFYNIDICSKELETVFKEELPSYIVHHAAQTSVQASIINPIYDAKCNILGTINLLQCSVKYNSKKLIYASSAAIYGDCKVGELGISEEQFPLPVSFYGISKLTPENYIINYNQLFGLKYTILRYANVYGSKQSSQGEGGVISIFTNKILNAEQPIVFGDGKQTRDFVYVKDVAVANYKAIEHADNTILNISSNLPVSINALIETFNDVCHTPINPIYQEGKKGDILHSFLNNSKAKEYLKWAPAYSLKKGLAEMFKEQSAN